jgi:hypothetical protein
MIASRNLSLRKAHIHHVLGSLVNVLTISTNRFGKRKAKRRNTEGCILPNQIEEKELELGVTKEGNVRDTDID